MNPPKRGVKSVTGTAVDDTDPLNPVINTGGSSPYLVYTALLTQTGTDAPVATVLQNTLGGTVVWTRGGVGNYNATLAGAFTVGKTIIPPFDTIGYVNLPLGDSTPLTYAYNIRPSNADILQMTVLDSSDYSSVELSTLAGIRLLVEIRVYP